MAREKEFAGAVFGCVGLAMSAYAHFIFDPTVSPSDLAGPYDGVTAESSIQDRSDAINDLAERYKRTLSGERIINVKRLADQQRIFFFGLILALLGGVIYYLGFKASRESSDNSDWQETDS